MPRARTAKVLEIIKEQDPALASEIIASDDPEKKIAEKVLFAKLIEYQKYKELDLETLLIALDFWKEIFDTAIKYMSMMNAMFMVNFLDMYSYVAKAVEERIKVEKPSAKDVVTMKALEIINDIHDQLKQINLFGGVVYGQKQEQKQKRRKRKKARH